MKFFRFRQWLISGRVFNPGLQADRLFERFHCPVGSFCAPWEKVIEKAPPKQGRAKPNPTRQMHTINGNLSDVTS